MLKLIKKFYQFVLAIVLVIVGVVFFRKKNNNAEEIHTSGNVDGSDIVKTWIEEEQEEEVKAVENITLGTVLTPEVIDKIRNNGLTMEEIQDIDERLVKIGTSLELEIEKILNNVKKI